MTKAFITATPFGEIDREPLNTLERAGIAWTLNPVGRQLTEAELVAFVPEADILIAGTEPVTAQVMDAAPRLKFISRVGIGLNNVDLEAARARGIPVAYTPEAPSAAVAEFTLGLMLVLLRGIHRANSLLHEGVWQRVLGRRLGDTTVGVIGVGRIGRLLIRHLASFGGRILANDLIPQPVDQPVAWTDKETIYQEADVISLHVPLTSLTAGLIGERQLSMMKDSALLINTSRGGIVSESALARALREGKLAGAALDVFEEEPYTGELTALDNCLLTCHMGSCSADCHLRMEIEAAESVVCFATGHPVTRLVPEQEYGLRMKVGGI